VCTGAFLLGAAGLLEGRRATTHWAYTHLLRKVGASFVPGRVVEDGNVVTCGGVTAGLDFALTLIAREAGSDLAQAIQLSIEYDPAPPFASGHPSRAPERVTADVRERVYDQAAKRMSRALDAIPPPATAAF
jgi:cyclohexyl-isocyanide hydratase